MKVGANVMPSHDWTAKTERASDEGRCLPGGDRLSVLLPR